jgi:hypothetical protein
MQDPGKPGDAKAAKLKERKSGATRKFTPLAQPEDAGGEATRNLIEGGTGGAKLRGDSKNHLQYR